jgi:hypothetical protein
VSEWFDRVEERLNEIAAAGESLALSLHRCADAVEMFMDWLLDPDGDPPKWPLVLVRTRDDEGD